MAKTRKPQRPKARQPRGFRDLGQPELARQEAMLATIRGVYDRYGFAALETPAFEFSDALGKFLPDDDRPNAGVFSLQDDDEQWLSLRYDLTAPLARYVAENYQYLPKPFRRYAVGPVWRNEKPGPGRYRQFMQFDADTVGSDSIAADAEICMLAADTLEALDIARGDYRIRVNNRKVLDAALVAAGIDPFGEANVARRLTVLRAMDKFDKFGAEGVALLLGGGRKDESGDFTPGAKLPDAAIAKITDFLSASAGDDAIGAIAAVVGDVPAGSEGIGELEALSALVRAAGYDADQIAIDPSIVRGLDYYTGPVMEADLTFEIKSEDGRPVQFGSVGGGGRYDDLVARFTGQLVPATGFSLGVSRLAAALDALEAKRGDAANVVGLGPVVVLVMDRAQLPRYQAMAAELRRAGIKAEMYVGTSGMKAQMKYADKRNAPCVVIEGEIERAAGEIQIKDLVEGARLSGEIATSDEWRGARPAQVSVPTGDLVKTVGEIVARYQSDGGNR